MRVTIANNADLRQLAEILVKLRYATIEWETHYGAPRRATKKHWEQKADEWIEKNVKEEK